MDRNQKLIWGISAYHEKLFELFKEWKKDKKNDERSKLLEELLNPVLTLEEARILLCICPTTARRWTNKKKLDCFRTPGGQRRFYLSQVLKCLEGMEKKGKGGKVNGKEDDNHGRISRPTE